MSYDAVELCTDAGSRGNPGRTAVAYGIYAPNGLLLKEEGFRVGNMTNNRAEYLALLSGLQACIEFATRRVRCLSDSQLMVRQLNGEYRVRDAALKVFHDHVLSAVEKLENVTFEHVPRTDARIARADGLVNQVLDESP